ncbi:MAG: hypothetical protein GWP08_17350, partial [Nitrospiraceae bacterium]|nr:hypothetical protein [Nitrospiraceae bacterium]
MAVRREDAGKISEDAVSELRGRGQPLLFHKQLTGRRLYLNSELRFLVSAAIAAGALFGRYVLDIRPLDVSSLLLLAVLLALLNIPLYLFARRHRRLERRTKAHRGLMALMHASVAVDFLFLTVGLWLAGGAKSPFLAFYLLHVILAAAFLSPRAAWLQAVFGYVLLSTLVLGEWWGWIPTHFPVGAVNSAQPLDGRYVLTVLTVQGALMVSAVYLLTGLTKLLRRGERELRSANAELERLSEMQRDFLHIALHDMKAPVGAASMLVLSFKVASKPPLNDEQAHWIERVQARLEEAMAILHDFSILAAVDSADFGGHSAEIDVASLIRSAVRQSLDMAESHGHQINVELAPDLPPLHGVERLVHEAVANLIANADKYTPPGGRIDVRATARNGVVRIEVEDNGIGIAPADQERLFREFVRVRRHDSAVGDVPGSGLGLSIVKRIVAAHGGRVGVKSVVDEGSLFFIELPAITPDTTP